jgi:hypothetical protein
MADPVIVVATHGHCFDGMASAAVFTHLLRALRGSNSLEMRYRSCGYGPNMSTVPEDWLDGDENAILDFRYTPSKKLSWYFDHHVTAFASPEEEATALRNGGGKESGTPGATGKRRVFYDATYPSCTKLIADVARDRFGVETTALADLVAWADTIDAARFPSAAAAVDRTDPVLQLASVVEYHGDGRFLNSIVPELARRPVVEVAESAPIRQLWEPIKHAQDVVRARVEQRAQLVGDVAFVDLTDAPLEVAAKFATYALYPTTVYSVMVTRSKTHCKLSVGYNPWSGAARRHDISAICRRLGGGGHPAVGAASFALSDVARAIETARAIVEELNRG